jgi:hypothetical protein
VTRLAVAQAGHERLRRRACAVVRNAGKGVAQFSGEQRCDGSQAVSAAHLLVRLLAGLRPAEVRGDDDARAARSEQAQRGQRSVDALAVRHAPVTRQRHVQVGAHQHALAAEVLRRDVQLGRKKPMHHVMQRGTRRSHAARQHSSRALAMRSRLQCARCGQQRAQEERARADRIFCRTTRTKRRAVPPHVVVDDDRARRRVVAQR